MARVEFTSANGVETPRPANASCCFAAWTYVGEVIFTSMMTVSENTASKSTELAEAVRFVLDQNWDQPGEFQVKLAGDTVTVTVTDEGSYCDAQHDPIAPDDISDLAQPA